MLPVITAINKYIQKNKISRARATSWNEIVFDVTSFEVSFGTIVPGDKGASWISRIGPVWLIFVQFCIWLAVFWLTIERTNMCHDGDSGQSCALKWRLTTITDTNTAIVLIPISRAT